MGEKVALPVAESKISEPAAPPVERQRSVQPTRVLLTLLVMAAFCAAIYLVDRVTRAKEEAKPSEPEVLLSIERQKGDFYYRKQKFSAAVVEYQKVIEADPENGVVMFRLADSYHRLNQLDKALEYYAEAAEFPVHANRSNFLMAIIHGQEENDEETMKHLTEAIENGFVSKFGIIQYNAFKSLRTKPEFRRLYRVEINNRNSRYR